MKFLVASMSLVFCSSLAWSQEASVASFPAQYLNWQTENCTRKVMGTDVDKAYKKLLKNKQPKKKIIVAIIDGGVDAQHQDLKPLIWINQGEIAANGIDDDHNGYIDDVHGWNYLGNSAGEHINDENLEVLRVVRKLAPKYATMDLNDVPTSSREEYNYYLKAQKEVSQEQEKAKAEQAQIVSLKSQIDPIFDAVDQMAGKKVTTIQEMNDIVTSNDDQKQLIAAAVGLKMQGLDPKALSDYLKHVSSKSDYFYNLEFNPRAQIIGDDVTELAGIPYGNPDVKGPDAFHGTFCAGIIGAVQHNGIGIDGITNHLEIMCLRAVPNGDEYDKDIALAIRYAADHGAQVVNMSFGKSYSPQKHLVDDAIKYAESKGVLLVHAAGNSSENLETADNYPSDKMNNGSYATNVITVGASTIHPKTKIKVDKKQEGRDEIKTLPTSFSNYGQTRVDLFAPGQDIVSTVTDSKYDQGDGTSFAAPVVSGIAALVWSYYPELTYLELKEILLKSVADKSKLEVVRPGGGAEDVVPFSELSVTGGVVNAYNALKLAKQYTQK